MARKNKILAVVCLMIAIHSYTYSKPHTLLWKIDANNKTLYLLGSIHIATKDMYPIDTAIINAFEKSDVLGVEVNINNLNRVDLMSDMIDLTGESQELLPSDLKQKILKKFYTLLNDESDVCFDELNQDDLNEATQSIAYLKPWGVALALEALKIVAAINGCGQDSTSETLQITQGIDQYFMDLADKNDKQIYEMETLERQIQVFKSLQDSNVIVPYLYAVLEDDDRDADKDNIVSMLSAWKNGDIKKIEKLLDTEYSSNKKVNKLLKNELIYKRNNEMAARVERLITEDKTYFIVVGAGHLVGKGGIIDILDRTGKYRIQRY